MKTRKNKTDRQLQIAEADELWQRTVMKRDGYFCQYPGCTSVASEAHHIIHKGGGKFSVRWLLDNGISLCREHHTWDAHLTKKALLRQASIRFVGSHERLQELVRIGNTVLCRDLDEVIAELRGMV